MSRSISIILGVAILGLLLSSIIKAVLPFYPYCVAGMVIASPFYGLLRKVSTRISKTKGFKHHIENIKGALEPNESSAVFYGVVFVMAIVLRIQLVTILISGVVVTAGTIVATFFVWEVVRHLLRKVRKLEIPSFKDAVKFAL